MLGFEKINVVHLEGDWIDDIVGLKGVEADVAFIIASEGEPKVELFIFKSFNCLLQSAHS